RYSERARYPHGLGPGRALLDGGWRHHLRQLDQERRRLGDRRPPRPAGIEGHAAHEVLELIAWLARLQPGPAESLRRRRPGLLLRRELREISTRIPGSDPLRPLFGGVSFFRRASICQAPDYSAPASRLGFSDELTFLSYPHMRTSRVNFINTRGLGIGPAPVQERRARRVKAT